ncbi:MAG: NADH-quinone oxidoreductase subunit H [bacterium]|nr:NADH-quinone oxidoreductase subunit H [bacterium]
MTVDPVIIALLAIVAVPFVGAIIMGLDRRLTARMQGRVGPPLLQPIYDVLKLLRKEPIVVNRVQVVYACLHLAFMILCVVLLALGQDMLMVLFVLAFSTIALILGGMSVRSPYSRIGSQREIMQMLSYEPILILMMVGIYLINGSFMARDILVSGKPLLLSLPLLFPAFLLVMTIKLQKSPFDFATSHHGHQEIVKGITLEYSGPFLAILEIAHWYETFLLFFIATMFWATSIPVGLLIAAVCFFGVILLDNIVARLTWPWMLRFMWTAGLGLAATNILWLYI